MSRIRVLIVEDSAVTRELLKHVIGRDRRFEIVEAVGSAEEALSILDRVSADVISMDIRLPGMNGFEATERIMSHIPTPIVVVSASVECADMHVSMKALQAGALTVLEKPVGTTSAEYESVAERLCTQLAIMSQVKVIRKRYAGRPPARTERRVIPVSGTYRMLGIVSSTGGPNALMQILAGLGPAFPLPVLLVQHITDSFLEGFASWLESVCPFSVEIVKDRVVPVRGTVYLATRDRHLRALPDGLQIDAGPPVCAQRPSGTVLLESLARSLGAQGLGVILTGMGEDGAEGLRQIRLAGGHTIAEDESTAVVYGMPAAAVRLNAASESLPLQAIAPRIVQLTSVRREVA